MLAVLIVLLILVLAGAGAIGWIAAFAFEHLLIKAQGRPAYRDELRDAIAYILHHF